MAYDKGIIQTKYWLFTREIWARVHVRVNNAFRWMP